ncbi:hypothetical protein CLV59_107219 [Chitinophaga dinghuensis]|uniref:Nucleotide-diphospho-sugar transferase n=1 Tax=Chitinophaga dinghuensis TaxID=1539050 RepID=A0A327W083_9BACT|nr:nucleotide-diphospho-sugar transferase [Chitinophaga dinghuensis]RAJ77452.1 hypothetical protein CLV59_107219 [Chitinophaga dinghuensis]
MSAYHVQSPILFLIFNRPDLTTRVFQQIRSVKPARLYVGADGPRPDKPGEAALCEQTRNIIQQVDWPCEVKTLFRKSNLGCKQAVSGAITWFFEQEEEGIIIEDDCLPADSFFRFCDYMLAHYRHDSRVRLITGANLQDGRKWGEATYFFSQYSHIWGWASWRRVWDRYDAELSAYTEADVSLHLPKIFSDPFLIQDWLRIFRELNQGKIDTWDYQLSFITFFENGLCVTPNVNLISNLGFREDATHTFDLQSLNANVPAGEITTIIHPKTFLPEKEADYYYMQKEFDLVNRWRRHNKPKRKLKRWLLQWFK